MKKITLPYGHEQRVIEIPDWPEGHTHILMRLRLR